MQTWQARAVIGTETRERGRHELDWYEHVMAFGKEATRLSGTMS